MGSSELSRVLPFSRWQTLLVFQVLEDQFILNIPELFRSIVSLIGTIADNSSILILLKVSSWLIRMTNLLLSRCPYSPRGGDNCNNLCIKSKNRVSPLNCLQVGLISGQSFHDGEQEPAPVQHTVGY